MRKGIIAVLMLSAGLVAFAVQQSPDQEVIGAERRALEVWGKGDPSGFLALYSDEITYFDPTTAQRVDGMAEMRAYLAPFAGKFTVDRFEIVDPKVQRSGDVAVLTFNVQNYKRQPDGTEKPAARWNSTEVFRRVGGKWRTIHSHWSYTRPELKTPGQP